MQAKAAGPTSPVQSLPSALERFPSVLDLLGPAPPRLFLDFDGTLSEIVDDPEDAILVPGVGPILRRLASRVSLAFISGRERSDVERRVGVPAATYAGSHGLDIRGPGFAHQVGAEAARVLAALRPRIEALAAAHPGVQVEEKSLGLALHYRRAPQVPSDSLESALHDLVLDQPALRIVRGKMVLELRPAVPWNKGHAVQWLLDQPEFTGPDGRSIYIGDDLTDEDALAVVRDQGLGIVVRGENDERSTAARFALANPGEVMRFLERLATHVDPR